ncbi:penicillin acylase family protein [Rhodobaculum claviforme]|uniref:Penicillin acylase n=1 Tax=Rhodobaculum claviforme TaxID=1549854 RepID=A0A934TL19_9RHOB|nr:penicillin acylase family protein [Rhodobaculum claviforme]MBK5928115.1 penicillin acylase [Rhodobaculum claviforme]
MSVAAETLALRGLDAPVTLRIDRWGIPHIRAGSLHDLFFAQGANAARDRLWQIDLWRKRGLGLLAADFGPGYLMQDRAARLFLYRGDMDAEWAAYGPDGRAICTAFAAGINAWIDAVEDGRAPLPPEFARMDTRPARWAPEDVVRIRTHCLVRNALSEEARAAVLAAAGPEVDGLRARLDPPVPAAEWDLGAGPLPDGALDVLRLATAPVSFAPERLAAPLCEAHRWSRVDADKAVVAHPQAFPDGSNNWAVACQRTATGRPVMASDPHRAHSLPGLRYLVHLTAPGIDVIGAGEPSSPGVMAGHNGTGAFSLTIFCADQEDVFVHDIDPEDPDRHAWKGGRAPIETVEEAIPVRGHPDQTVRLRFTRQGPVVHEGAGRAIAIRTVLTEAGAAPYMAALQGMRARDLAGFRAAMAGWVAPTVSQVWADTGGTIAWMAAGRVPQRHGWRGLVPMPGDGRFDWDGAIPPGDLPLRVNPPEGFVHSANEMNLPADWPHDRAPVGYEWHGDGRATRIADVLGAAQGHTLADSAALQGDVASGVAARLVALLPDADDPATALLKGWDGRIAADSGAALLFELWLSAHLKPAVLRAGADGDPALAAPLAARLAARLAPGDIAAIVAALEGDGPPPGALASPGGRRRVLTRTLAAAWDDAVARQGPDPDAWAWGRLHVGHFPHPLGVAGWDVGPLPTGGGATTVMMAAYEARGDFRVRNGASVRLVIDVGGWDNSLCINAPGQSGVPGSAHYADLAPIWAAGGHVPLLYSVAAVEAATRSVLTLVPG